jgi:hypothetical protein
MRPSLTRGRVATRAGLPAAHRRYAVIGLAQAVLFAFATDALFVPFLLFLGADVAFVTVLGVLPVVGSAAQIRLPSMLRRVRGDIGRLTLLLTVVAETRGLWFALAAAGWAAGLLSTGGAIAIVSLVGVVGGAGALLAESTLLAWANIALPDRERRAVVPRMMGTATGASALLLLPAGLLLNGIGGSVAGWAYAAMFGIAAVASVPLLVAIRGLPRSKPVSIHPDEVAEAETPSFRRFTKAAIWNSVGTGFTPYLVVFAVAVHGMSPGFGVVLSGSWAAVSLVSSVVVAAFLRRGSASWVLRIAYGMRFAGAGILLLAFPGSPIVVPLLLASTALNAAGFNAIALAQNEQLFRLAGRAAIAHQGRFMASNAAAYTVAGFAGTGLVALAERLGFGAWVALLALSAAPRVVSAGLTPVPRSWQSASLSLRLEAPGRVELGAAAEG